MTRAAPPLVLHVVHRFAVGGLENGLVNLVNRLPHGAWRHAILALTDIDDTFRRRIARDDVRAAGRIADSLAAQGVTEPMVSPLIVASRAAAMAARGRIDSADAILALAARRTGGAEGRWYEQHRALLASATGRMPRPALAAADTVEPVLVLVRAALSGDRDGVVRAAARLRALPEVERRRRGRATALAQAWMTGPEALRALAVLPDANDVEADRPLGPVVVAIARRAGALEGIPPVRVPASELPARLLLRTMP